MRHHPELTEACAAVRDIFAAVACVCALVDDDGVTLEFRAGDGAGTASLIGSRMRVGEGLAGYVALSRQSTVVMDVPRDERFAANMAARAGYMPTVLLGTPLVGAGPGARLVGILQVLDPDLNDARYGGVAVAVGLLPILEILAHQVTLLATGPPGGPGKSALAAAALRSA